METHSKAAKVIGFINRWMSDQKIQEQILRMRNQKQYRYAEKIHGRHAEDLICLENLNCLSTVSFEGIEFPVQPDAMRMLEEIYGQFDIYKNEINRHKIILVAKRSR